MIKGTKICGISDIETLNYLINHTYPPQLLVSSEYKKSKRYVEFEKLKQLINLKPLNINLSF